MAISKSTPYVRYKKDFTSSLHLGTIHIESEYLDRTQKTTIESIHGMTWHNKVVNENKELNLLSDTQLELTDLEKQYWNTGEKRVSVDEIHTLEEVEPNEDGTYTYTVNSMEGEYIEIYNGINNITSTSDGLDGQFEIVYDTTEEDINGNIALDAVAPQYEITDSGVGAITGAKSTGLTLVNHITEPSKEEVVAIEQQEGQHFTINNTVQGNIKSAILKGQTLVNISPFTSKIVFTSSTISEHKKLLQPLKQNTKYILIFNINNSSSSLTSDYVVVRGYNTDGAFKEYGRTIKNFGNGRHYILLESTEGDVERIFIGSNFSCEIDDTILAIYQEGMENWDIPYFEGMQSVKMPALTTTGKNLFELPQSDEMLEGVVGKYIKLNLKPNTNYTYNSILDKKGNTSEFNFYGWISNDINSNFTGYEIFHWILNKTFSKTFNTGNDEWYFHILSDKQLVDDYRDYLINFQIEEGSIATEYEPYKTNILTVNEEVELRGIGDVQDELDLMTGELTQRIGEVVVDGSSDENWATGAPEDSDFISFYVKLDGKRNSNHFTNNKMNNKSTWDEKIEGIWADSNIILTFKRTSLSTEDVTGCRQWLSQNPITIQYQLATESIKTVDLTVQNQDGNIIPHIQTQPTTTHVSTSSDSLTPTVEMSCSYDTIIKPNTTYTIKLDRLNVSDTMYLQVDLGGTMMMLDADVNAFTIKTPSTLSHSQLRLSGTGNTVKEIIVLEGNRVNDKIEYFEGMKNVENPILVVSNCPSEGVTFKKYQSTTLSLNEPIQLRSIGDVYDEINYETGEYIQRIGEIVFDGSEDEGWSARVSNVDGSSQYRIDAGINIRAGKYKGHLATDKFITSAADSSNVLARQCGNVMFRPDNSIYDIELFISNDRLNGNELKQWLSENPITVFYVLAEPIISTVDHTILDQNNSYKSFQQTYDEQTYVSVQSDTVVTPTSSVDYEIYSSTGTITGTSATIDNAEVGTPVSGVVYGETLLNVIQEPSETEYVITGDAFDKQVGTLENTVEGNIKSAILKGKTLVNLVNDVTSNEVGNYNNSPCKINVIRNLQNETLTIIFNVTSLEIPNGADGILRIGGGWSGQIRHNPTLGVNKVLYNYNQTSDSWLGVFSNSEAYNLGQRITISDVMVLEGDYINTNIDIPYFEGMQSVKVPGLTTTGKNLFHSDIQVFNLDNYIRTGNDINTVCDTELKPSTTYTLSWNGNNMDGKIRLYSNGVKTNSIDIRWHKSSITFTTSEVEDGFSFYTQLSDDSSLTSDMSFNVQLEEGTTATPFEPYKSNILTVNEDVTLHRIGDVQDELNLITGELTQRIYELVLDGSEEGWIYDNRGSTTAICYIPTYFTNPPTNAITNYFSLIENRPAMFWNAEQDYEMFCVNDTTLAFKIEKTKLKTLDSNGIKEWLSQNNLIIRYDLATPITKTISTTILDQDDKPTDNLHTFDTITHISTYAQGGGLIPFVNIPETISYDTLLKTNTQYTVKLNRTNIVEGTPLTVNLGGTELSIEDSTDSFTITTPSTLVNNTLSIGGANNKVKDVMVIEGDCVDRDLDFFEGFISVENPIVSTISKNLMPTMDKNNPDEYGTSSGNGTTSFKYNHEVRGFSTDVHRNIFEKGIIGLKPNTTYTISVDVLRNPNSDATYDYGFLWQNPTELMVSIDKLSTTEWKRFSTQRTTDNNGKFQGFCTVYRGVYFRNIQIEEGMVETPYEPYQGNTLTTYPQVTLRSIGDVKDEWDVVGETVTRRIGEVVLDGSENWKMYDGVNNYFAMVLPYQIIGRPENIISDKIQIGDATTNTWVVQAGFGNTTNYIFMSLNGDEDLESFILWLRQNPVTIQYKLAEPITESVRITPPNPQTSSASITIPTQLNYVEDTSDFLVWNPYKEHYVRYNYVEDGVVLDNYTWENLTDLNERQFVEFYNRRTYIDQPYHNYVASHDSKGTSKYVLIEPNQDYTVSVRFSELPTCETVKVNLGGAEVEMNVNEPHVHVTTPNTLVNNLCSISGDGLDGKVTDILVIHCLEHEGFADIDYFEGIDGIGEIVEVEGVPKSKIIVEQTNGNLLDIEPIIFNNGNYISMAWNENNRSIPLKANTSYRLKMRKSKDVTTNNGWGDASVRLYTSEMVNTRSINMNLGGVFEFTTRNNEKYLRFYKQQSHNGNTNIYEPLELTYAHFTDNDLIRPRYYDKEEILLPMQLHRINTVYDNFYYDEMKGYYRIQQSIGHKYFVGADSENWTLIERGQRVLRFRYNNADIQMKSLGEFMTNILPNGTATSPYECCAFNGINFIVSIDKERLSSESLTAFKEWLTNNNLHLYYQLASPLMIDLPQYPNRIEFNTYKDEIYTFFKNCKPTVFTLAVPLDQTYRFYELEQGEGYANRVELTDERMTEEDTLYIDTIHGSGFSNLIENPNNVETLLKPNYQGKAVSHTLTNSKVSSIKVHGFEPNETTIANYNSTLKQYELIVQAQKEQNINTQTLAVPYKLEVYEDGTKDKVYYDEQNKVFRFEGGSVTNPPYNNSYIFNTPLEVFKGIAPRTGLIAEIKVKFNSGTTSARIYYSLDGGATTAYSTLRSMTDEVEYYIGFFNTGGTKLDYATKLSAEAEYINLAPLSSTLPESLIITQIQNISECTFTLDKTYYFDSWIKPLELDVYNGETIITEQSGAIVTINNNGLHKDALTYTDETYTVYWTYVGGEGNVTITLGGTKVEVVGTQGYATLKTAIDGVQDGLIIGGYNLSIKDLMLVKGERIEDLAYFEGSRAVGTAFVDENGETKYKITLVTGSELINDKFENRITFEDNNKHNVVVTKLLGNKPNKK